jgi:hypothetical protein
LTLDANASFSVEQAIELLVRIVPACASCGSYSAAEMDGCPDGSSL